MIELKDKILERMSNKPTDVYFASDFNDLGELEIIGNALIELDNDKKIKQLTEDVYAVYVPNIFGGENLEYPVSLAKSFAIKTNVTITDIGAYSANVLGFSTQNVMGYVFLTSGEPMIWDLDGMKATFRQGTYEEMFLGNTLEGFLVRAWCYLEEQLSFDLFSLLYKRYADQMNWNVIIKADKILPEWMIRLAKRGKRKKWR